MPLTVFYSDLQQVSEPQPGSPSPGKPARALESWQTMEIPLRVLPPLPALVDDLCLAHDPDYVREVLDCAQANGFGTRSESVAASLPWTVGSMVSAALHALESRRAAISPTSGFHHAGHNFGGGYCTFNGLMVAASKARQAGAKRVGILDLDQHYGNGTADIIRHLNLDFITHWTLGGSGIGRGGEAEIWVTELSDLIEETFTGCDLLLYQAGADSHEDDPLGGTFTTDQMRLRDRAVFESCSAMGLPIAWNLAGGYRKPLRLVLDLHDQTLAECARVFSGNPQEAPKQVETPCNRR